MLREIHKAIYEETPFDIFCIGTPTIIGDSVGPLIGSKLSLYTFEHDVQIIGTLDDPVTQSNYESKLTLLRPGSYVIAIDAILSHSIGDWEIELGPLTPGAGVNAKMRPVGHASISCYTANSALGLLVIGQRIVESIAADITTRLVDLFKGTKRNEYIR